MDKTVIPHKSQDISKKFGIVVFRKNKLELYKTRKTGIILEDLSIFC